MKKFHQRNGPKDRGAIEKLSISVVEVEIYIYKFIYMANMMTGRWSN